MTYNNNVIIILSYLHTSPRLTHDKSYNLPAVVNVQVHNMIACQSCKTLLRLFRSTHPFKLFSIRWRTYQGWPNGRRRSIYLQQSIAYDLRVDLGYFSRIIYLFLYTMLSTLMIWTRGYHHRNCAVDDLCSASTVLRKLFSRSISTRGSLAVPELYAREYSPLTSLYYYRYYYYLYTRRQQDALF